MKALAADSFGGYRIVLSLREVEKPEEPLEPYCVLVKVAWSDVNPVDLQKLNGGRKEGEHVSPPFIPGYSGSGEIVALGSDVEKAGVFKMGSRIAFLVNPAGRGSFAEFCVVDSRAAAVIPDNVSLRDSACVPLAGCTAHESLQKLKLDKSSPTKPGQRLVVVGGSGGVGSWAIRLCRAWHPSMEIIATVSSKASEEWCTKSGATQCVRHDELEKHLSGGQTGSVDAILCLTEPKPELLKTLSEIIRPYGHVCFVVAGSSIQALDLGFFFFKSATISFETVFNSFRTQFSHTQPGVEIAEILELMGSSALSAPVCPRLGEIDPDWSRATAKGGILERIESNHTQGKLLLHIGDQVERKIRNI